MEKGRRIVVALVVLLLSCTSVYAQSSMTVLTGRVMSRADGKVLPHVSVSSPDGAQ